MCYVTSLNFSSKKKISVKRPKKTDINLQFVKRSNTDFKNILLKKEQKEKKEKKKKVKKVWIWKTTASS